MFSIQHIAIIFVVVLVVFGPEKLPELARNFGKIMGEFRKATGDLRNTFDGHMRDLEREADLRVARERAANAAVMTPLPAAGDQPSDPAPPAPANSDPSFVPADGIVASNAPYTTAAPRESAESDAQQLSFDTKPLPFDDAPHSNAPVSDRDSDAQPEKVTDGRTGAA
jgi:sec-independent protein translocase protein TatB